MSSLFDLKSCNIDEISTFMKDMGEPSFRATQIFKWLNSGVKSFDEMTNLPLELRRKLSENAYICVPETLRVLRSEIDGTVKYLRSFEESAVESVLMKYNHGNTVCVSSQSGCRMGCAFCASTINNLERCLKTSEILDQVIFMEKDENVKISNIVLMGTGEPLDNYDNVLKFLHLVNDPLGMNIGQRHISLSTCGLADKIVKLSKEKLQITLSVSLHAPFDELRSQIMPVNRAFPLKDLLDACREYFDATNRRISFEYAMIDNFNDTDKCAAKLAQIAKSLQAHINLIPLNKVKESKLSGSSPKRVREFQELLISMGANATVRRKLGPDINASCGQLRNTVMKKESGEM